AGDMEQAGQRLERDPDDADESQQEALKRLNEARQRLQQAQEEVEEELARERLAKVADLIKRLKERQEAALAEGDRIEREVLLRKQWDRGLRASLGGLADTQDGLAKETKSLAEGRLAGAKVFTHILAKAGSAMERAAERFLEHQRSTANAQESAVAP